jgi:mannitol/fructose-specific phosphotransferase system IIA component (Ntr-type)
VGQVPESVDFLEVAKRNAMTSADFMKLTGFLNAYGWDILERTIEDARSENNVCGLEENKCSTSGPCVWPFLRKRLIFDVIEAGDKVQFLNDIIERIADRMEIFDRGALAGGILEREGITSTGIGGGVAVPHAYLPELKTMIVAIARVPAGLDFDAIDGIPVRLAILLAGPSSAENLHLRLLARIAKLMSHANFCNGVMAASGSDEIISLFKGAEFGIP